MTTETPSSFSGVADPAPAAPDDASPSATPGLPVSLSPATIHQIGGALFTLWLKIGATLLLVKLLALVWPVLVLLVISLMLVATFNPLVRSMQRFVTRAWAITAVVIGCVMTTAGLLVMVIPPLVRQAQQLMVELPSYLTQIESAARKMHLPLRLHGTSLDLSKRAAALGPEALNVLWTVFSGVTGVLTVAVLTTYLLIDGPRVATGLVRLLPRPQRLPIRQMFAEIGLQVGGYMRGQLITSVLSGIFSYVLLYCCGVPEALSLACLMAVSDAIPMVGPLIGTVPAVLMALPRGAPVALTVLVGYVLYHQIESHVLVPRIYGKTMSLSPSVIVIAILIGATLLGTLGALLALPVAAAIPVVMRYVQEWHDRTTGP